RVVAVRACADDADRAAGRFLQRAQVGASGGRQLVPDGDAVGVLAPAGELEVDRRDLFPALRIERRVFGALAAVLVGDADLELLHAVEHVELGDAQAGDAVDGHGALERDDVDPAAAARAPRRCAVLGAAIADALADLVVELGGERAAAHARGIGLGDAEHVVDRIGAHARAGQRAADGGVGAGDVGIGAVVDVEQRALRAFAQHALALLAQVVADAGDVGFHRLDVVAEGQGFVQRLLVVDRVHAQVLGQHEVVVIERGLELFGQLLGVMQVGDADAATRHLVLVRRTDAAAGGADGLAAGGLLARLIERDVVGHDQRRG